MRDQLEQLQNEARARIAGIRDAVALEAVELEFLGRKQGRMTAILRGLGALAPEERKVAGALANTVKAEIGRLLAEKRTELERTRAANLGETEWTDVTLPGTAPAVGSIHPVTEAIREISAIFERIGFIRVRHPEVDSDYYAFEALNMPSEHPARDEWETFFVKPIADSRKPIAGRIVLTPHTSNGQVREMEQGILPIRMVNIGKCYRRQLDATHTPMFHQFEGFLVDRGVAITHLKGTLDYFVQSYFGKDRRTRLRPFHFQFTEPSFEIDISCAICGGTGRSGGLQPAPIVASGAATCGGLKSSATDGERCKTCKSGWLELGGAGMVHPNVLRAGGVDPKKYGGFAFGWGVERVLMMKESINDIRLLYGNDLRWLKKE